MNKSKDIEKLEKFDPTPTNTISPTNPWSHLGHFELSSIFHNYYNLNCELVP